MIKYEICNIKYDRNEYKLLHKLINLKMYTLIMNIDPNLPMSRVFKNSNLCASSMFRGTLDTLKENKIVIVKQSKKCKRSKNIKLTKKGERIKNNLSNILNELR